jgi:hypothetical protein
LPAGFTGQGVDPLTCAETIRILSTEFRITSNIPELIERLAYLTQRAEQDLPVLEHCEISVQREDGEYRISGGEGKKDDCELSLPMAFEAMFARLHDLGMRHFPDHIRIHAASGFGRDGMVLLVGEKWSGKTTTAVHLLLEGFEIVGDELVLLRHGQAVTFPRPFYLRHSAIDLLPKLGGMTDRAPFVHAETAGKLIAIDPLKLGRHWKIRPAPVGTVVFLEPNHGGTSSLRACSKVEMVRRVLAQSSPPSSGREDWVADFCSTINEADTVIARMGDLASATDLFRRLLS